MHNGELAKKNQLSP